MQPLRGARERMTRTRLPRATPSDEGDDDVKSLFLSLLLKHVLEQISGKALFSSIHQKFSLMLLEVELPATDIFDLFLADVEQLDIVLSVA